MGKDFRGLEEVGYQSTLAGDSLPQLNSTHKVTACLNRAHLSLSLSDVGILLCEGEVISTDDKRERSAHRVVDVGFAVP